MAGVNRYVESGPNLVVSVSKEIGRDPQGLPTKQELRASAYLLPPRTITVEPYMGTGVVRESEGCSRTQQETKTDETQWGLLRKQSMDETKCPVSRRLGVTATRPA